MKRLLIIGMLAVSLMLMACGGSVNCGANNPEGTLAFESRTFTGQFCGTNFTEIDRISAIIRSSSEFDFFFNLHEVAWDSAPMSYDNTFFENNTLILFFFQTSGVLGSQVSFSVDSVEVNNNIVTLNILSNVYSNIISDVELIVPFVVEISNENIQGITEFSVNFITGQHGRSN